VNKPVGDNARKSAVGVRAEKKASKR
jgi:hypothetical protein